MKIKIFWHEQFLCGVRSVTVREMRVILLLLFVGALAFSPWYMFDQYVLPDLSGLKAVYGNAEPLSDIQAYTTDTAQSYR